MKKYFFIIALYWFNTCLVIAQSPHFRIYDTNNDILGPVTEMPTNAIADDFGPRYLDDGFHAGVDFNCYQGADESQRWWMIVSPENGLIADFDRLTHGTAVYKYGLVNAYDGIANYTHTWLFGHVFDKTSQFYDNFDHSIVLKRCEEDDNDKWGLLLDLGDGLQYAYGQIPGATLKVNNQTYTTINVINTVNPFLPLGNSGGAANLDSVSYNLLVDNKFIMGNVGFKLSSGLRDRSSVDNIEAKVIAEDNGLILQAYPNPFSEQLNISVSSKENIHGVLEVYDIMGQKIYTEDITVEKDNIINRSLQMNNISSGIYTISLLTNESIQNIKVLKVK